MDKDEQLCIEITRPRYKPVLIALVYRAPNTMKEERFIGTLTQSLCKIDQERGPMQHEQIYPLRQTEIICK